MIIVKAKNMTKFMAAKFINLDPDFKQYIKTEIQVLQTLKHPNIMRILDDIYLKQASSIDEFDKVIIISELAEESLEDFIQRKKNAGEMITEEEVLKIFI